MDKRLALNISTPERELFNGEIESLVMTTTEGELGVLPDHTHMVVTLGIAPVRFKTVAGWLEAALSQGFAMISGDEVIILADSAEWPDEIEVNRALEAKHRAEERLHMKLSGIEYLRSQVALKRALTRLQVSKNK